MVEKPEDLRRFATTNATVKRTGIYRGLRGPMEFDGVEIDSQKNVFLDGLIKPMPIPPEDLV